MNFITETFNYFSNVPICTGFTIFGGILFSSLIWEHIGRKREMKFRPSIGLEIASKKSRHFFKRIGSSIAWLSSYLTQIDLKDIGITIESVFKPTWNLLTSPLCVVTGYIRAAAEYANKQWLIYLGSTLGIVLLSYGFYSYSNYISLPFYSVGKLLDWRST